MKTKAYLVEEEIDGLGVIVFAEKEDEALLTAEDKINSAHTSATRKPEYDHYAELGYAPINVLINDGWWFDCHQCSKMICHETEDEEVIDWDDVIYENHRVYCSSNCKQDHQDEIDQSNQAFHDFKERVKALRPDLNFDKFEGEYPSATKIAHFHFEGSRFGGSVRIQDFRVSDELEWAISRGDMEKWEEYEKQRGEK